MLFLQLLIVFFLFRFHDHRFLKLVFLWNEITWPGRVVILDASHELAVFFETKRILDVHVCEHVSVQFCFGLRVSINIFNDLISRLLRIFIDILWQNSFVYFKNLLRSWLLKQFFLCHILKHFPYLSILNSKFFLSSHKFCFHFSTGHSFIHILICLINGFTFEIFQPVRIGYRTIDYQRMLLWSIIFKQWNRIPLCFHSFGLFFLPLVRLKSPS